VSERAVSEALVLEQIIQVASTSRGAPPPKYIGDPKTLLCVIIRRSLSTSFLAFSYLLSSSKEIPPGTLASILKQAQPPRRK
jgi:hypothetical protein